MKGNVLRGRPEMIGRERKERLEEEDEKRRRLEDERDAEMHREHLKLSRLAKLEEERHMIESKHLAMRHDLEMRHLVAEHELDLSHFQRKLALVEKGASFDGNGGEPPLNLVLPKARGRRKGTKSIEEILKTAGKVFAETAPEVRKGGARRPRGKARRASAKP